MTDRIAPNPSDHRTRIAEALAKQGAASIAEYAEAQGASGLTELASRLDVPPIAVQMRYEQEARSTGDPRELAEDLLFRCLQDVRDGWPASPSWEALKDIRYQLIAWCDLLRRTEFEGLQKEIVRQLLRMTMPPGWRPQSKADPVIRLLFDRLWNLDGPGKASR